MPTAQTYQSEFTGQQMDAKFTAVAELQSAVTELQAAVAAKYSKPSGGIPATDLDADVNAALAKANSAVQSLADYYTKSEVDAMVTAINAQEYVDVASLPTASASTLGKIYLVGPTNGEYARYITTVDGSTYDWVQIGTTEISMANYATKTELSQLEQKVSGANNYTSGAYLDRYDDEQTDAAWGYTDFIPYTQGNDVEWKWGNATSVASGRAILFYDSSKTFIALGYWTASGDAGKKTITSASIASDAGQGAFIRASFKLGESPYVKIGDTIAWEQEQTPGLEGDVASLKTEVDDLEEDVADLKFKVNGLTVADFSAPSDIYSSPSGTKSTVSTRVGSGIYAVSSGEKYKVTIDNSSSLFSIVALDSNKDIITGKSVAGKLTDYVYEVESPVKYLYFSHWLPDPVRVQYLADVDEVLLNDATFDNSIFADGAGHYINSADGTISDNANYSISSFIGVNPGDIVFVNKDTASSSALLVACYINKNENAIVAKSFAGSAIYGDNVTRCYTIPENIRYIRFTKKTDNDVNIKIVRRYNKDNYINSQRKGIIVGNFSSFDNLNWTKNGILATSPSADNSWSITKGNIEYNEDDSCMCCRIVPTSSNNGAFEGGIGKTTADEYTGVTVYATIAKDGNGSYLKVYQYNFSTSQMEEIVARRVTLSEGIELNKEYFVKIVKETNSVSTVSIYALNSEGAIIGESYSENVQYWGAVSCLIYNGEATFQYINFSYPKADYPKICVIGDSYVEGGTMPTKTDRWVGKLKQLVGVDNCVVLGKGGASLLGDNPRYMSQLQKVNATYTILESVGNDKSYTYWLNGLTELIKLCEINGSIPILTTMTPMPNLGEQHATMVANANTYVRNSGYYYFDCMKAVSDDETSWKAGYVLPGGIHPSVAGHLALYNRLKVDCPFLFE